MDCSYGRTVLKRLDLRAVSTLECLVVMTSIRYLKMSRDLRETSTWTDISEAMQVGLSYTSVVYFSSCSAWQNYDGLP